MATRKNTFLLKRSNVPGKVPSPGDLRLGELALNTADVILYASGTTKNQIIPIGWDRIHRTGDTVTGDFVFYGDISISGSSLPNGYALSVTGDTNITNNLYVGNTITATTIGTSGNCIDDIYVSNIHSCSPLNINPFDEGNVYFGSTSGVTIDLSNNRVGIGITSPTAKIHVNNTTSGNTFLVEDNTNPDSTPFVIDTNGNTGIGTLFPTTKLDVRGDTIISSGLTATTINVPPLADDKIVYTTNNGRLTTTSNFTYNQSNNTFSVNNINANGNFNITGNTTQSGTTNQLGDFNITGDTTQLGNFDITGDTFQLGNTTQTGNVNITGNTVIDGSLSADTVTITNTPTLNNTLFQILGRNETTGDVEYRQVNTIGNNVTILTGGTYSAQTTIDNVIGVDTSLTTTTIYLPDSVSSGRLRFEIKDIGLNAYNNPITIIAAGTDTIISYTNSQTLIMESEGGAIILFNTGLGQWWQM